MLLALQGETKSIIEMLDRKIYNRLICLEKNVRLSSQTQWTLEHYEQWLEEEGLAIPQPKTCRKDFTLYANLCKDVDYPSHAKVFKLNPLESHDAIACFLGQAWVKAPLKLRLSSSIARCFLLAMLQKREVVFQYEELDLSNYHAFNLLNHVQGIPIDVIAGTDSAYIILWKKDGSLLHFNLARVLDKVVILPSFRPDLYYVTYPEKKKEILLSLRTKSQQGRVVLKRLEKQFSNMRLFGAEDKIDLVIPEQNYLMIANLLEGFVRRTTNRKQDIARYKKDSILYVDDFLTN